MAVADRRVGIMGAGRFLNLLAYNNNAHRIVARDSSYEAAGLPVSRLGTVEPSEVGRILTLNPEHNNILASTVGTIAEEFSWDGVALVNHNLSPWGLWRQSDARSTIRAPASGLAGSTNVTGSASNIDEDLDTPDGAVIGPTVPANGWSTRVQFSTSDAMVVGAHMAYFVFWVLGVNVTTVDAAYPQISVDLYENGVFKRHLGARAVTKPSGQFLIFTFDPSEVSDTSVIEAFIQCSSYTPPLSSTRYINVDAASLGYEDATTPTTLDTGWLTTSLSQLGAASRFSHLPQHDSYFFPASVTTIGTQALKIIDDQVDHFEYDQVSHTSYIPASMVKYQPSGYIQAGVWVGGPALFLTQGLQGAPVERIMQTGREGTTEGGQPYAGVVFRRRGFTANFMMTEDEKNELMDAIDWQLGMTEPFYVATMANIDPSRQRFNSGYVVLEELSDVTQMGDQYVEGGDETQTLYLKSYTFGERL